MRERLELQKDLFHRTLRLHALRSREENFELFQLAVDDSLVFDLAYHRVMECLADEETVETRRSKTGDWIAVSVGELLYWLSSNRSAMLNEVNTVVDSLGGIEIATYLLETRDSEPQAFAR